MCSPINFAITLPHVQPKLVLMDESTSALDTRNLLVCKFQLQGSVPRLQPKLVLMDESTSALDTRNERLLYQALRDAGAPLGRVLQKECR